MMIGFLLLLLSVFLYTSAKQRRWAILLFIIFATNGMNFLVHSVIGFYPPDLALLFVLFAVLFDRTNCVLLKQKDGKNILRQVEFFLLFLVFCILFSLFYYGLDFSDVIKGGRQYVLLASLFFLAKLPSKDVKWLFSKPLFYITLVNGILYIVQVLTNLPVLPYSMEPHIEPSTGLFRYYNSPKLLSFYLYSLIIFPSLIPVKRRKLVLVVFFIALILTQGRTAIFVTLAMLGIGIIMKGDLKKMVRTSIILIICSLPFIDMIMSRFTSEGATESDLKVVLTGDFRSMAYGNYQAEGGGNMAYRFAWVAERVYYLADRTFGENVFGLGLMDEYSPNNKYNFFIGLADEDTGRITQIYTSDTAIGSLLCNVGYLGLFLFLSIWFVITKTCYKFRKTNRMAFVYFLCLLSSWLSIMNASSMANSGNLIIAFIIYFYICRNEEVDLAKKIVSKTIL